jgi:hypothetical protein
MTLAATMASSVVLASRSAILGYHQSALVCTPRYFRKYRGQDEETAFSRNCCAADGNIGIGPINKSCGWLLRWRWNVCRKSLLLVWDYVRHPSVPGQNFAKSSARAGYTQLQGIRSLRTAEAAVKKLLLTSIAALFLATGAAHATEMFHAQCGHKLIYVFGRNGWSFGTQEEGELPERQFRLGFDKKGMRTLYFRVRKCHHYVDEISGQEYR